MNISVSMITLDEEEYISQAIKSCSFADSIVIIDGGSKDNTISLITSAADEIKVPATIEIVPWNNHFGVQHQHSTELVPPEADWWIRLDSDEIYPSAFIENIRPLLEQVPEHINCCRIRQVNLIEDERHYSAARGGWETWPRIFRNVRLLTGKTAWQWQGQVHEYCRLMTRDGLVDPEAVTLNLPVVHYGWLSTERRQERENLYVKMQGSGFEKGSITDRIHVVKEMSF